MSDIEAELGLTRDSLIRLALLLGSDYTEGVAGIGVVNAVEVVHAFRTDDELRYFRSWVDFPDPDVISRTKSVLGKHWQVPTHQAGKTSPDSSAEAE